MLEYDKIEYKDFKEQYGEFISQKGLKVKKLYNLYYTKVEPYLQLIANYRARENAVTQAIIAQVLGVGERYFRVMKEIFKELEISMNNKHEYMDLVAQKALITANNERPDNAKTVEMMLFRWDKEYKKNNDGETELPSKLDITIRNAKKEDEELEDYAPEIDD